MPPYIALLRGINLGAKRRIAMADLRALLAELGYDDVRTHLQSGNAIFTTATRSAATVERALESAISQRFGMDVRVVVRTPRQLAAVVEQDPFPDEALDHSRYMVIFLEQKPPAGWLESLDADRFAPDRVAVVGTHVYLWMPNGLHESKLATLVMDKKLGGAATARNFRTVLALAGKSAG